MIYDHPERSLYDTFLELQGACQLMRLGRTAEAAAAMPDRVPGDAITSTGTYYAAMRANLALLRGENDAARAALEELRRSVQANRHPQWVEVLETMTIELALREGRLEDARAAAARGLPEIEGTEEGGRLVKLLWAALRVEAEAAERSRATFDDETARTLRARLANAVTRPGAVGRGPALRRAGRGGADPDRARARPARHGSRPPPASTRSRCRSRPPTPACAPPRRSWPPATAPPRRSRWPPRSPPRRRMEARAAGRGRRRARAPRARCGSSRSAPGAEPEPAPLGLTPREHEVLLLVAEGHTNREIGEQLFMSEKTASVHVSRILAKLDVGGRVEAAAVAHRLGLTAGSR